MFQTNPLGLYLGDTYGSFQIGAEQTLIPTKYSFQIIKSESSISSFYAGLSKYSVSVSNSPINIILPATITMPKGGCSLAFKVKLNNPPFLDLKMSFEYDNAVLSLDQFWINE